MNKFIYDRVLEETNYILKTKETIRQIAKVFLVSKSTVHKDLQERLLEIDTCKYNLVKEILNEHTLTRHIKGGESTRLKYKKNRS